MFKQTKATDISRFVKELVYERDNGCCVICGRAGLPEAHFIRRSQGGLGVDENIVTLCRECHEAFDNGNKEYEQIIRNYLQSKYPEWDETKLIYKKYGGIFND